ncbi:MAG: sigma-70 family RNA polymerase sigma factor [Clostridiales bacterium]|nr:sigma-70 family RNA polymerase sigma factor [Candidatus Cacconaster stercorequi]
MDDKAIIDLYWTRDEAAIRASDEKYGTLCLGIARNIVHNPEDAEECLNDTWVRSWNAMPPQRPNCLRAFFVKITRNLSLSRFQQTHAQKRGGGEVPAVLEELSECVSGGDSAEDAVLAQELSGVINRFLYALPRRSCDIFLRRYFYMDSTDNIAKRYGMTVGAVGMDLSRSRKKLRAYLEEEYHD